MSQSEYIIYKIFNGKRKTYDYRSRLKELDFEFNKKSYSNSYWNKKISNNEEGKKYISEREEEFSKYGLKTLILYPENRRSSDYREIYLDKNKGFLNHYFCSYCGKILNRNTLRIDHVFPIDKVSKSKFYKCLLRKLKIENINNINNLAPACKHCNSKKGSRTGLWLIRGFLGRYTITWLIIWSMLIISVAFIIKRIGVV